MSSIKGEAHQSALNRPTQSQLYLESVGVPLLVGAGQPLQKFMGHRVRAQIQYTD